MATIKQLDEALSLLLGDEGRVTTITAEEFNKELEELSYNYASNFISCDEQQVVGDPDSVRYHLQLLQMIKRTIFKALESK